MKIINQNLPSWISFALGFSVAFCQYLRIMITSPQFSLVVAENNSQIINALPPPYKRNFDNKKKYCRPEFISGPQGLQKKSSSENHETLKRVQGYRSYFYDLYSKSAFTLAETLITLVIVGVIAALTVPTLITKYQKEQTVTRLKKVYSALAQTTNRAIADNGPLNTWEMLGASDNGSALFNDKYLLPYLNVAKNCGIQTDKDCEFRTSALRSNVVTILDNTYARFYLADGTFIASKAWVSSGTDPYKYITLRIDINGQKGPNQYGKDIFKYQYMIYDSLSTSTNYNGKFVPESLAKGYEYINDECSKHGSGHTCSGKIMKDGWRIADDYPW